MNKKMRIAEKGRVQFISHFTEQYSYVDAVKLALKGGCSWIQLRMKGMSDEEVKPVALEVQTMCRTHDAIFIIDDRVLLVREIGADGVHLGRQDMPVDEARQLLGNEFIIGGTANTFEDISRLASQGADYIGCGPFRFTTTKEKLSPLLGAEGYHRLLQQMAETDIHLPLVAIGGITLADLPLLVQQGVTGVAVSGAILRNNSPSEEMKKFIDYFRAI